MNKSMCITYEVGDGLYINVTNRCTNACSFCIRKNGDGAYGSDSLWLEHEPTEEEILAAISERRLSRYSEVVFCGYGEPSLRLEVVCRVARAIKEKCPTMPVRINTNGHSDLIFGRNTAPDYCGAFDTVSISLNAPTEEKYREICHPVYDKAVLNVVIEFAKNVNKCVQNTLFTVVRDFITEKELSECESICHSCGIPLKVRDYISG